MEIKTRYNIGDRVWTVHRYPVGARVFEGKIYRIVVNIVDSGHGTCYYIRPSTGFAFPEATVYSTKEEAEQVRQDWIDKVNKADDDD